MKPINRFVKKTLEGTNISKTKLAEHCGCSRMTIHRIINGEHEPSFMTIEKLFNILGVDFIDYELHRRKLKYK